MRVYIAVTGFFAVLGMSLLLIAVRNERHMQWHRKPGVTFRTATMRRDGGWRRSDLFTGTGLEYQRRAAGFGIAGTVCLLIALAAFLFLRDR